MIKGVEAFNFNQSEPWSEKLVKIDAEIANLLEQTHMQGRFIELDYQAKPSFLKALECQGDQHDLALIRPEGFGELAGLGIRSVRKAFLAGKPSPIGYLHHLRLHPEIRGGHYLARGYRAIRDFFSKRHARVTLTSILEENEIARDLLEHSRPASSMPVYQKVSRYLTALIPLKGPGKRWPVKLRPTENPADKRFIARKLSENDFEDLQGLFAQVGSSCEGIPVIEADSANPLRLKQFPGLNVSDFVGIFKGKQLLAACGIWNQQAFRQIRVLKLGLSLRLVRKLWNLGSPIFGKCPIPPFNGQVNQVLLDPWAIIPGYEKEIAGFLLSTAVIEACNRGHDFAAWGVCESHMAAQAIKSMYFIPYWSIIYQVYWPEHGPYNFEKRPLQLNLGAL